MFRAPGSCLPDGCGARQTAKKIIGDAIREYRKKANMTQEKLAEKAELHPVYVGEVERGEEAASVEALLKIAKALHVRLRDIVEEL